MQSLPKGILVAIEGIDGSGKSTLARNLYYIFKDNIPTTLTKEPGSTELGLHLRALLQEQTTPLCPKAEFLLFAADRAQHFYQVVIPALARNELIISDRMADSSLVYQGYARGLDKEIIAYVNAWAMEQRKPDLTLYMRIDPQIAYDRLKKRGALTAFEKKLSFTQKLVAGFDHLYHNRSDVYTLDSTQSPEELTQVAKQAIEAWIKNK